MSKKAVVYPGWLSCVINRNICQRVRNYLELNGIEMASSLKQADYIVYAGCAVTEDTELQSLLELDYLEEAAVKNATDQKIILIGCFPKMNRKMKGGHFNARGEYKEKVMGDKYQADINSRYITIDIHDFSLLDKLVGAKIPYDAVPYPDEVSSIHGIEGVNFTFSAMKGFDKEKTQATQRNFLKQAEYQNKVANKGFFFPTTGEILTEYGYKHVMVGQGCKNNCAYCAIKFAKTKIKSVPAETILSQIKDHLAKGETKIILLCDDLRSWGLEIKDNWISLLTRIMDLDNKDLKLALFNVKVEDILAEKPFFDKAVNSGKISYLGLMGQHVNKRILKDMRREPFSSEDFLGLINGYGKKNIHMHTYNIVGFPGETEEEFAELLDFVNGIKTENFSLLNFPYSDRPGTLASTYPNKISYDTIMSRTDRLNSAYYDCSEKRFAHFPAEIKQPLLDLIQLQVEQRKLYHDYIKFLIEAVDSAPVS